jgi:hypothetical protein
MNATKKDLLSLGTNRGWMTNEDCKSASGRDEANATLNCARSAQRNQFKSNTKNKASAMKRRKGETALPSFRLPIFTRAGAASRVKMNANTGRP